MKNCTLINLDTEGRIISWNKDAEGIMGYRSEEILGHNIACLYQKNDIERDKPNNELIVAKIKGHFADEGYRVRKNGTQFYANVIITPLRDDSGKLKGFLEIIYEIADCKLEEEVLRRLNRELRAIRNCNQILLRAVDEQTLLNEICHVICNEAGYILAWVGYAENDDIKTIRPKAWSGTDNGYISSAKLSWADNTERGLGPTGIAIRNGEIIYIQDFITDPRIAPWRECALQRGFRSCIALPLKDENTNVFGALNIYSAKPNAFTPEEIRLLDELSGDLAYGIITLRTRAERNRVEEALQKSEERFRVTLDNLLEGCQIISFDWRYLYVNETVAKHGRRTKMELLGHTMMEVYPGIENTDMFRILQRSMNERTSAHIENEFTYPDGSTEWFELSIQPTPEGIFILSVDITERMQMEKELTWERYLMRSFLDNIPDYIYFKDLESKFVRINNALAHVFGLDDPFMALGKTDHDFFKTEHSQQAYNDEQEIIRTGKPLIGIEEMEVWFDRPPTWVSTTKMPLINPEGKIIGTFGISRNITERKLAEEKINTLSKAVEQSPSAIIITNSEGKIQFVNTKYTSLLQYSLDDVKWEKPRIFNPGHISQEEFEVMWKNLRSGDVWQGELKNRKKDGTMIWENVIISPLVDKEGEITNYILIIDDITEKKKMVDDLFMAKEKAEESDHLKTAFLQNISHEIRTPLNAIVGFSSILGNPGLPDDKKMEFINIINVSSDQLLSIVSEIIALATLEAGQEQIVEKETDINQILLNVYEQFMISPISPEVAFSYHPALPDELAFIYTDPVKLMQILVNLVGNALKFTLKGTVRFGYTLNENTLEFFIEDTGIGIPEDMHEIIFERFRQVDNSLTRKYGGTGLGLALSKGYVSLLGGSIKLISEQGKGSTFSFTLPYKPITKERTIIVTELKTSEVDFPLQKTVLVAEDETNNFLLINEMLTSMKLKVIHAKNGLEAVNMCISGNLPDLVLMDIKMPVMDGIEATKKIKDCNPGLPVVALTAFALEFDKKRIFESGFNDYLVKPFHRKVLSTMLLKHLNLQ